VQWKSIDVPLNGGDDGTQCSAGEYDVNDPSIFLPYTANKPQKLDANGAKVTFVTNLGSHISGIPGFWAVDPHSFDNPVAFQSKAFGDLQRITKPSDSYDIDLEETSSYISSNFETGIYSGNIGARIIQSTLGTNVYTTDGQTRAYGDTLIPTGRQRTEKTNTEILPSFNLSAAVADDVKLRLAVAKTKQELDLDKYGSSLAIDTIFDVNNPTVRVPLSWSSNGNPNLKPWLATNFDFSAEYYVGQASMFSMGAYYIKIDSFVDQKSYNKDIMANGKTYNLPGQGPVEGSDGKVQGIELSAKLAFSDFTTRFLNNFGLDTNYTYSPSQRKSTTNFDANGKYYPFADNSKNTYNLALWYEQDKLQARVALNHRDDRYVQDSGEYGYSLYELGGTYVDANVSYDFGNDITLYLEGSNITSTDSRFVYRLTQAVQQDAFIYDNEARYTLGVRAKF
jgi:iron complex outermembrane recepter protein